MTRLGYRLAQLGLKFNHLAFQVLVRFVNLLPKACSPLAMRLADLAGRIAGRDIRFILENGTVREIQQLGDALSRSEEQKLADAGRFVQRNAEHYVMFRVFKRWFGGRQ